MSEIRSNTVSDAAGTGPAELTGQNAAKMTVYYDQSLTTSASTLNVSSLDDNSAGLWDINFTNNFASANFAVVGTSMSNNTANSDHCGGLQTGRTAAQSPMSSHSSNTLTDRQNGAAIHGDLA
jgi:hypothetical protein